MSRSVKTTYRKAASSPSTRQKRSQGVSEGISNGSSSPLAPLVRYVTENEGTGIPMQELIEQFRELDCEHTSMSLRWENSRAKVYGCACCGHRVEVLKPGVK